MGWSVSSKLARDITRERSAWDAREMALAASRANFERASGGCAYWRLSRDGNTTTNREGTGRNPRQDGTRCGPPLLANRAWIDTLQTIGPRLEQIMASDVPLLRWGIEHSDAGELQRQAEEGQRKSFVWCEWLLRRTG